MLWSLNPLPRHLNEQKFFSILFNIYALICIIILCQKDTVVNHSKTRVLKKTPNLVLKKKEKLNVRGEKIQIRQKILEFSSILGVFLSFQKQLNMYKSSNL